MTAGEKQPKAMKTDKIFYGIPEEDVLLRIEGGETIASIAESLSRDRSVLWRWLHGDEQRSARARAAMAISAYAWDEKAEQGINNARDPFELSKAKEMAHHYRWRARVVAPKTHGDKTTLAGDSDNPLMAPTIIHLVAPSK